MSAVGEAAGLRLLAGSASLQGFRSRQEDSVLVSGNLLAVADGLGGHRNGDAASKAAVRALWSLDRARLSDWPGAFDYLNAEVDETSGATTLTVVYVDVAARTYALAWAGDSPALHLRRGEVIGRATPHGYENVVLRCLGGTLRTPCTPEVVTGSVEPGDVFLLASDGLDVLLDDGCEASTIRRLRKSLNAMRPVTAEKLSALCERLAKAAIAEGSEDNVTVVVAVVLP